MLRVQTTRSLAFALVLCAPFFATAQAGRVEGVILDQAGAPVVGAEVVLSAGGVRQGETRTDGGGRFGFDVAVAAALTVAVSARGFADVVKTLEGGGPARLEIVLAPAPLGERVTVAATRTEASAGETAAGVSVMGRAQVETTAAARLDDALRQVAGFQLFRRSSSRTANPTTQGVSLRGTGASGASRALVFADGVPLNDPFGGWVYWARVPRESVAAVEVLRGGASHLYGGGALGGVVEVTTRRPAGEGLSLELSGGNERTADGSLYASARRGGWGVGLGAEVFTTRGYVPLDERPRGRADTPAGSRNSSLVLTVEREARGARVFARGSLFGEARANGTALQTNRTHLRQLSAGAEVTTARLGTLDLRAYGGAQTYDQTFTAVSADRNSETLTRAQRVPAQSLGASTVWSRAFGARETLVAGVEWREVRGASDEVVYAQGRATSLVGAGGRERTAGLFVETLTRLSPRLTLAAGARLDAWRNYVASSATRSLTRPGAVASVTNFPDRAESAFSPQLSVLYKPAESVSLFASGRRAFRQPTLNELYRTFRVGDVQTLANENLRAERLTGGEAGVGFDPPGGRLSARVTFFWDELTRPVANVTLSTTPALITRQRQNLGRTRARGLEVEWEARPSARWSLSGGYLLADSTVTRFPVAPALEGLRVPQVPQHQLTLQARYSNPAYLTASLQARASGVQFDDDQNRFRLARYFTLDAFASRRLARGLEAFAAAENLTGARYETGRTPLRTTGPPLLLRAGLRLRLGAR